MLLVSCLSIDDDVLLVWYQSLMMNIHESWCWRCVCLSAHLAGPDGMFTNSFSLSVCLFVCLSVCLFVSLCFLGRRLFTAAACVYVSVSVCPSVCLCVWLSCCQVLTCCKHCVCPLRCLSLECRVIHNNTSHNCWHTVKGGCPSLCPHYPRGCSDSVCRCVKK